MVLAAAFNISSKKTGSSTARERTRAPMSPAIAASAFSCRAVVERPGMNFTNLSILSRWVVVR